MMPVSICTSTSTSNYQGQVVSRSQARVQVQLKCKCRCRRRCRTHSGTGDVGSGSGSVLDLRCVTRRLGGVMHHWHLSRVPSRHPLPVNCQVSTSGCSAPPAVTSAYQMTGIAHFAPSSTVLLGSIIEDKYLRSPRTFPPSLLFFQLSLPFGLDQV